VCKVHVEREKGAGFLLLHATHRDNPRWQRALTQMYGQRRAAAAFAGLEMPRRSS